MDREGFLMSWFQISDRWQHLHSDETAAIKPDAETYAYFLQDLIECCMTHPDDQGKRAWRDERDVWKLEEYRSTLSKTEKKGVDFMDAATAEMKAQLDAAVARERIVRRKAGADFCHEAATENMCKRINDQARAVILRRLNAQKLKSVESERKAKAEQECLRVAAEAAGMRCAAQHCICSSSNQSTNPTSLICLCHSSP